MNDNSCDAGAHDGDAVVGMNASTVRAFHDRLDEAIAPGSDPVEELRALEELRNAISARQAHLAVTVHDTQSGRDVPRSISDADTTRLVGSQLGLARRCTPRQGSRFLQVAHALTEDMPRTLAALAAGVVSEHDVTRLVTETAGLSRSDRAAVDAWVGDDLGRVSGQRIVTSARRHVQQIAPDVVRARRKAAEAQRRVSVRPAPDCMAYLSALLPVKDALACHSALDAAADEALKQEAAGHGEPTEDDPTEAAGAARPAGTRRDATGSRGRAMADALVQRLTGRAPATGGVDVRVDLLMPWDTLVGDTPGHVPGYGPVPADLVREWFTAGDPTGPLVRRLFTQPGTGDLVGMESRARRYPGLLAWLIRVRDDTCRTPWCSAPVRHTDHIRPHAAGGPTSERNGQGLCARCNYVEEHPDFHVTGTAAETRTETAGLVATSHPPAPPGLPPPTRSHVERTLIDLTWQHAVALSDPPEGPAGDDEGRAAVDPDGD
ncbi:DUF222 domain-containing protein [Flexivirga sp. B27]